MNKYISSIILIIILITGFFIFFSHPQIIYAAPTAPAIAATPSTVQTPTTTTTSTSQTTASTSEEQVISNIQNPTQVISGSNGSISNDLDSSGKGNQGWVFVIWKFCLNLCNLVLIAVLIYLGIVNILNINYDEYQLKKYLLPLIISVVLANFSLFICRAIVEFAEALTGTFLQNYSQIADGVMTGLGFKNAATLVAWMGGLISFNVTAAVNIGIPLLLTLLLAALILAVVLLLLFGGITLLLYARWFIILALAAISPLAFIFMILPLTKNLFQQWWGWFLRWVFIGPLVCLILRVAALIGASSAKSGSWVSSFVLFCIMIGMLILAILVPFIIGGGWFGNLVKNTAAASERVPFLGKHITTGKGRIMGYLGKFETERKQTEGMAQAEGMGFAEGGFKQAQIEKNLYQSGLAGAAISKMEESGVDSGSDENLKKLTDRYGEEAAGMVMLNKARKGELTNEHIDNVQKMVIAGKIKNPEELKKQMNNALRAQSQYYAGRNQSYTPLNNLFNDIKKEGNGYKKLDSRVTADANEINKNKALNNIDSGVYNSDLNSRNAKIKQQAAVNFLEDFNNLEKTKDTTGLTAEQQKIHDKAQHIFNAIEADSGIDVKNNATYKTLATEYGREKHLQHIKFDTLPGSKEVQNHAKNFVSIEHNIDSSTSDKDIENMLRGRDALHQAAIKSGKTIAGKPNVADIKAFLEDPTNSSNTKAYDTYKANNDKIELFDERAKQIADDLLKPGAGTKKIEHSPFP